MFTLEVGTDSPKLFTVHKAKLCKSDVFAAMRSDRFAEGQTQIIKLPEDDPMLVGRLLEFLYGDEAAALRTEELPLYSEDPARQAVETLLYMFVIAEKFQLEQLRSAIVKKLERSYLFATNGTEFFRIIAPYFSSIPTSCTTFYEFFSRRAYLHLDGKDCLVVLAELEPMIESGGPFAVAVFRHLRLIHGTTTARSQFDIKANMSLQADLAKARRMHTSQHPACSQCHVLRKES